MPLCLFIDEEFHFKDESDPFNGLDISMLSAMNNKGEFLGYTTDDNKMLSSVLQCSFSLQHT